MTADRFERSVQVALFLVFNLALLVLAYGLIVRPAVTVLSDHTRQLDARMQELARYRALAGQEAHVREMLGSVSHDGEAALFLTGANEGAAGAFLQAHLRSLGNRAGLQVRSMSALGSGARDNLRQIGAQLDGSGPIASIHAFVSTIEASVAPVLFVDAITIRAPASTGDMQEEPVLNVQMSVSGVLR